MRLTKAIRVLGGLLLAPCMVTAQNNAAPPKPANETNPSTQMFDWSEKRDVYKWLQDNKSSLDRGDGCSLNVSYGGKDSYLSSAVHNIASFVAVPEEEQITRMIHDSATDSGLDVRVGVRYYHHDESPSGTELQIAIAFEGSPEVVFVEMGGAQAWTVRDKNWKWLRVEKGIVVGDLQYSFSLECVNGKFFLDFLRRPAKHKSHPNQHSNAGPAPRQFAIIGDSRTTACSRIEGSLGTVNQSISLSRGS